MGDHKKKLLTSAGAGLAAGTVNGIFGAAGGMVLIPALQLSKAVQEDALFPMSVSVMLPVCAVSIFMSSPVGALPWAQCWPYLVGSVLGGAIAGRWGQKIPLVWLHRLLGAMILWGGIRYLC